MARTEERIRRTEEQVLPRTEEQVRTIEATPQPHIAHATTTTPQTRSLPLAIAWMVLVPLSAALQPAAAVAEAGWLDYLVSYALLGSVIAAVSGLVRGRSWAGAASLGASAIFLTSTFACPATGHHAFGLWWFGQLAIAVSLVAMSGVHAWRSRRPSI